MSSTSPGQGQWSGTWNGLPGEIQLLILRALIHDGCPLSGLVTVCRQWQTVIERHIFSRIRLTPSRLADFDTMLQRNRVLVRYIWFCLELDEYDCATCAPTPETIPDEQEHQKAFEISGPDITTAFRDLFSSLSTWNQHGGLTLDISLYSPSDSEHWFKYLTFVPDIPSNLPIDCRAKQATSTRKYHDPEHGWVAGFRQSAPPMPAFDKIFHPVMKNGRPFDDTRSELQWWDQLPTVPVVTCLLLRQQNRRRWKWDSLAHMIARLPRLRELHYEPWREWDYWQFSTYTGYFFLLQSVWRSNKYLKRLVVFENFNQQYTCTLQRFQFEVGWAERDAIRKANSLVGKMLALMSLKLEHVAASFIADATDFFEIEPSWEWPSLKLLVLTSKLLTPDETSTNIEAMLRAAASAAMKMPQLETMEIWNGRKGLAALFRYQAPRNLQPAVILWRGTWDLAMEPRLIQAWKVVMHQHGGRRLDLVQEWLDKAIIKSHGDALHHLMLSGQVIRPVSLQQIQMEQEALEGVETR